MLLRFLLLQLLDPNLLWLVHPKDAAVAGYVTPTLHFLEVSMFDPHILCMYRHEYDYDPSRTFQIYEKTSKELNIPVEDQHSHPSPSNIGCCYWFFLFRGMVLVANAYSTCECRAIQKSNCYHNEGHNAECYFGDALYMLAFGVVQLILSQINNFHNIQWLSVVAAIMSFAYSIIGLGLGIAKVVGKMMNL